MQFHDPVRGGVGFRTSENTAYQMQSYHKYDLYCYDFYYLYLETTWRLEHCNQFSCRSLEEHVFLKLVLLNFLWRTFWDKLFCFKNKISFTQLNLLTVATGDISFWGGRRAEIKTPTQSTYIQLEKFESKYIICLLRHKSPLSATICSKCLFFVFVFENYLNWFSNSPQTQMDSTFSNNCWAHLTR